MPADRISVTIKIPVVWPLSAWVRARQRLRNRQAATFLKELSAGPPLTAEEREEYHRFELELAHDGGRHDCAWNAECPRCLTEGATDAR